MESQGKHKVIRFRYLLILLFCLANRLGFAQTETPFFENISTDDGLSHSSVNYILQDHNGFMWFATYNGLNKYDGRTFKVYQKNPLDKTSISSNDIFFIHEDKSGFLWIVNSATGLDKFDPATETFENYSHDASDPQSISSNDLYYVTGDSYGNIWICAGNTLNLYVPPSKKGNKTGSFEKFRLSDPYAQLTWVYEESPDRLLLFSEYLYYFDRQQKKIIATGIRLENSMVTSLIKDERGNLLIGTVLHGVLKLEYDKSTGTYRKVDPGKINVAPGKRSRLFMDHNKDLWIGTEGGLYRYSFKTGYLEHFQPDMMQNGTISDNTIYSIYEDKTGVLWVGTFSKGLDTYDFYRKPFLLFSYLTSVGYVLICGFLGTLCRLSVDSVNTLQQKKDLENKNLLNEIKVIKSKLNPHLLFNTMNNIDTLILKDPQKASDSLSKLSDILRYIVYDTENESIPIEKEVEIICKYIDLERLRLLNSDSVNVSVELSDQVKIPPMIIFPIVENCFKHSNLNKQGQKINILISSKNNILYLKCFNTIDNEKQKVEKRGFGLDLTKKRLKLLYPDRHHIEIIHTDLEFTITLQINLHND